MLGGQEPILIFQFSKKVDTKFIGPQAESFLAKIPLLSDIPTFVEAPPIPLYLSEQLTGLMIVAESKNVDAETSTESKTDGSKPDVNQKAINSIVSVELEARRDSLGLTLAATLFDLIYEKLTSQEYAITYLNGPVTVFRGLLHSFSVNQTSDSNKLSIKFEIARGATKTPTKTVGTPTTPFTTGTTPLG